jgi:hypothetical protein
LCKGSSGLEPETPPDHEREGGADSCGNWLSERFAWTEWTDEATGANGAIATFKLEDGLLLNVYPRTDLARD